MSSGIAIIPTLKWNTILVYSTDATHPIWSVSASHPRTLSVVTVGNAPVGFTTRVRLTKVAVAVPLTIVMAGPGSASTTACGISIEGPLSHSAPWRDGADAPKGRPCDDCHDAANRPKWVA